MSHPLRIFYLSGPGDPITVFRNWLDGRDDPSQIAVAYTHQFFDVCRQLGASAYVVGTNSDASILERGEIRVEHRPPSTWKGGVAYHLGQARDLLGLVVSALRFRADVFVCSGTSHWFLLWVLPLFGVRVIPSLHCVLWPKYVAVSRKNRWLHKLNGQFFGKTATAILSLSDDVTAQLHEVAGTPRGPIIPFLPSYRRDRLAAEGSPPASPPFRVLFAGRIERHKGVFDLLEIARRFAREGRPEIEFDLCGTGGALDELRRQVDAAAGELLGRFRLHGHCDGQTMGSMFRRCHVVIVPTTAEFIEGFNKVVAEGVLAGRPIITSMVCPALEYVREAVEVVPPDDVRAYGDAVLRLADDPDLYHLKCRSTEMVRDQFYDLNRSWGTALRTALVHAFGERIPHAPTARESTLLAVAPREPQGPDPS